MRLFTALALLILFTTCDNPVEPDKYGSIRIVLAPVNTIQESNPDSLNVNDTAAKPALVDSLEVRILQEDNSLVSSTKFSSVMGIFEGTITVKAQDNLKVLCIGTNNGVVERFGIDDDVDVQANKQTDATITGWLSRYIPEINPISPNPATDGNYTITWDTVPNAPTYTLQEADNPELNEAVTVYTGNASTKNITGQGFGVHGMYYYRVQASNVYGVASGWSVFEGVNVEKQNYTLSGTITGADSVMVGMTGSAVGGHLVETDGGTYSITVLEAGTYFVRPQKSGYTFEPESHDFFDVTSNETQDFVATKITQTLTMAVNQSGWGTTTPSTGSHTYDIFSYADITAIPASGYQFVNWTGGVTEANSSSTTVPMWNDKTVTAVFALKTETTYTLTMAVNQSGWGTTDPSVGTSTYDDGSVVTITATPASGYRFVDWTGVVSDASNDTTTVTMSGDLAVTANFEEVTETKYTLTMVVNQSGWGTTTPATGASSYDDGSVVTITATPSSGYRFVNWTGDVSDATSSTTTVTMSGDITVTANFEKIPVTSEIEMVSIPAVTTPYEMATGYTVTLSAYQMSATEVTNAQYANYLTEALTSGDIEITDGDVYGKTGDWSGELYLDIGYSYNSDNQCWIQYSGGIFSVTSGKENWPVVAVTWYGSMAFAEYNGYDLPTEAEWEYAASGGMNYEYGTDDGTISGSKANYYNYVGHPTDGGSYPANPFGLYDMCGNVYEWCSDKYWTYPSGNFDNPTGSESGSARVYRGGSWNMTVSFCQSNSRRNSGPEYPGHSKGFRVVSRSNTPITTNTISGAINGADGVTVTLSGDATGSQTVTSDGGSYSFTVREGGNYTVTPSKTGISFTPASQTFNNVTSNQTQDFTDIEDAPKEVVMVTIPGGSFRMGDIQGGGNSDELPVHTVSISAFEMSIYEITQGQYQMVMGENPSNFIGTNLPVGMVTWYDAVQFCNAASDAAGLDRCYDESSWECDFSKNGYRLPTEAEWEYACREGTETNYYNGNSESDLERAGWYLGNNEDSTHPVGQKESNEFGLYDMHGSVVEWCNDLYDESYYSSSPSSNPTGPSSGPYLVFRGGSWADDAGSCRSAVRSSNDPLLTRDFLGFRVVRGAFIPDGETAKNFLTMSVNNSGWGTTTPAVGNHTYDNGTNVTITATPASGYRFVNWTGDVTDVSSASTTITLNSDQIVTANFELIQQTTEIEMVSIPGGTFEMGDVEDGGDSDEKPVHTVTVSSFEMSIYEVTNSQYAQYLTEALASGDITASSSSVTGKTGDWSGQEYLELDSSYCEISYSSGAFRVDSGKENRPVVEVTWYGSKAFANYYGLDLPREAEWEYACRGGRQYEYGTSDGTISSDSVNYYLTVGHTTDVGSYSDNPYGLYDMSGNVWEWCGDWYGSYTSGSANNPTGEQTGSSRVFRSGSWSNFSWYCRSATRGNHFPGNRYSNIGFRVVSRSSTSGTKYTISGTVIGADTCTVTLSGDATGSETVSPGGSYSFTVNGGGNYTVTPSLDGFTFLPSQGIFNNIASDQTQDFRADVIKYIVSGTVTGADEVTVKMSGAASFTQTVNSGGSYSFTVWHGYNYVVTPSKEGYTFTPESMTYSEISSNKTQDYTASQITASDGKIVFQSDRDGKYQVYTMNVDGSSQTRLTDGQYNDFSPSWSPDGSRIVFASDRNGNFATSNEIYVMDADGSNQTRLTSNSANDYLPSWSPDGARIVYGSTFQSSGGYVEVYVMDADGSNQRNLTNTRSDDFSPSWSSDSSQISFESRRSGDYEIYVMNDDGSNLTNITNTPGLDRGPSWSPDGSKIAFYSERDGNYEIYVMDADGSNQTRVTNNSASDFAPSWSPDSSQIVFYSDRDGNPEIYIIHVDGSNETRLTDNPAIDNAPSWSPF